MSFGAANPAGERNKSTTDEFWMSAFHAGSSSSSLYPQCLQLGHLQPCKPILPTLAFSRQTDPSKARHPFEVDVGEALRPLAVSMHGQLEVPDVALLRDE